MDCEMDSHQNQETTQLGNITEYPLKWPSTETASTHELVIDKNAIYVTGQNMGYVAKVNYKGEVQEYYPMPENSGPHGILIDNEGKLWVSLEFHGQVVQLNKKGEIVYTVDVRMAIKNSEEPINPAPHGICLSADGQSIWFTGKRTSTVGKFSIKDLNKTKEKDVKIAHFELDNLAALPIFLSAGANGTIWGTELQSSAILNVTEKGRVKEFTIPTSNSRPIAIIPDPNPKKEYMWFTQETGVNIGRIDMNGNISEYPVPTIQEGDILGSLVFDGDKNLWVQVYNSSSECYSYLLKLDRSIRKKIGLTISDIPFSTHVLTSRTPMLHRIKVDFNGNLWFTEMMTDRLGVIRF